MIKDAGGQALFIEANVAIAKQAEGMIAKTIETYGRLDCAFNNAGIEGEVGPNIADCSEENLGADHRGKSDRGVSMHEV
jgi:NAD(P)-dependent dehydrogenase (short-subunit alcohol dehydrogenase family)